MTLLQLQDVTYCYKNTAEAVLYQIKYNFEPGKFYSIIGESGAGKSTLLSLAGLDSPVRVLSFPRRGHSEQGVFIPSHAPYFLVFQNYNLIDYLSPLENIRLVNKKSKQGYTSWAWFGWKSDQAERSPVIRWSTATCGHRSQFSLRSSSYSSWWANRKSGP